MATLKVYNMSGKSFFWYRILPGVLTLLIVTSPVWTSLLGIYDALIVYLAFLATYILYKSIQQAVSNYRGYKYMIRDKKRNWVKDLQDLDFMILPSPQDLPENLTGIYFLLFIPIYKESYTQLEKIIQSFAQQDYPYMKNVIPVLAVEESAGPEQKKVVKKLKQKYKSYFGDIWDFYHPYGISGEIVGDACSNLRWAAIKASKVLAEKKIQSRYTIFNKCDSDTIVHKKFLSALTYTYLTTEKRKKRFYAPAILTYSNNYWKVPGLIRVFSSAMTLGVINEWVAEPNKKQSFSCYAANFRLLEKIDYWDASTGAEDTYFYWNALLHLNGDFSGKCFFLPITMDAVEGHNTISALKSLYKQQLRWGWGALIMPIAIQGMIWNKKIKLKRKLERITLLTRAYSFTLTISTILVISMPILQLLNKELEYSTVTYLLPKTISYMMTTGLMFQLPAKYYLWKFYGSPPKNKTILFKIWWWGFEHFLIFINVWTYYIIPRIQAQYELTIGKQRKKFFISVEGRLKDE